MKIRFWNFRKLLTRETELEKKIEIRKIQNIVRPKKNWKFDKLRIRKIQNSEKWKFENLKNIEFEKFENL